jgi:hypothetical protein
MLPEDLLDELARVFARAAVDRLLLEQSTRDSASPADLAEPCGYQPEKRDAVHGGRP